ncbi:putative ankyrin repeat protein [Acanthamoeba castellanii mimivirus]|uniref:Putative ankyrin repeat protein L72 n=6 Tax=Mimivirus TaxID=315393 RepID=YL072_MIMIV|nr:putative ankyrin repeat protein [Acanthamoeba polyphaga mimivirus]Q5UPF1.1 RecName: Full=Putative ankyrin repeat protein L72 [Acanthamoeba polyphaga mimivirus]AMZ02522.1 putative ankyrin repeat protein [Mimivirus Bombay]BAV61154.1 putative ankyrin repeat protein [Acanthamoeba castellanii mimivirus]AAV50347.1 ankyrin containing protein [Acanthamoeba polyphaga mimivirus]ADO18371.1 putative ankyrin repeat protein [Acanthamoeba polyphaga mimivirus]BAV62142.1 putative ankyrin repeat protein [Ac
MNNIRPKYYAFYNKISEGYYNPLYRKGLNKDTIYEIMVEDGFPTEKNVSFVSIENIFQQINFGSHIAEVFVPGYVKTSYNETTLKHYADMCIIGDIMNFYDINTIRYLIDNGANIKNCGNLLCQASQLGCIDIVKLLVKTSEKEFSGMDDLTRSNKLISTQEIFTDFKNNDHNVCILIAIVYKHIDVVKYFISIGEILSVKDDSLYFKLACDTGCLNIIKYLLEIGFDIESNNNYCLMISTINGRNDIVEYIKSRGVNPNNHVKKCIQIITNHNDDLKSSDIFLMTKFIKTTGVNSNILYQLLLIACEYGYYSMTMYLIKAGIKPTNSCLKIACKNNKFNIVKLITKYPKTRLDINVDNNYCMKQAIFHKNKDMVDYLTNFKYV